MPWKIQKRMMDGKQMHCVVKEDDGSTVHCHPTRAKAMAQMRALYASENKEAENSDEKAIDGAGSAEVTKCMDMPKMYVPYGVTSFAELKAAREADQASMEVRDLAGDLQALLGNRIGMIMMDEAVADKPAAIVTSLKELAGELAGEVEAEADGEMETMELDDEAGLFQRFKDWLKATPMKTVDGKKYPASDFLVAEDAQSPSTWHLQVKRNGKPDRGLASAAWAALFSPGGHRGNQYAGPGKEAAGKKLRALYNAQGWELPGSAKEAGFLVWKEADGSYRWLARYSNNFRDQDNPPEIISAKSHQRFVELVDKGQAAMPELWLWHRPEWRWGRADWLAYDATGFALAAGRVDKGREALAEQLTTLDPELVRVSHGMPTKSIVRDPDDASVIVEHETREISPLPAWAAANVKTGFIILKEVDTMAIPEEKRAALIEQWGLPAELLSQIEAANSADAKEAEAAGIESKEVEGQEVVTEAEPPASVAEPVAAAVSREELTEVLGSIGQALQALNAQMEALGGEVKALKEAKDVTEAATLSDIFQRAIGRPETRVDGRTVEAKARPQENQSAQQVVNTGKPLADLVVNSIVTGEFQKSFARQQS